MGSGLSEIGLVLFTTLAPAGALAFCLVAFNVLQSGQNREELCRASHILIIPLSFAVVGLIASATQLGTPANALNVFNNLGSSPLSNEVLCSVCFLLLAGVYWLVTFYDAVPLSVLRLWLVAAIAAAVFMIGGISLAYGVYTIPLWNSPLVPMGLVLSALVGATVLAACTLRSEGVGCARLMRKVLFAVCLVAIAAETVVCIVQYCSLDGYANAVVAARDLVPAYPLLIAVFALAGATGVVGAARYCAQDSPWSRLKMFICMGAVFVGVFFIRLVFYGLHMTVGF